MSKRYCTGCGAPLKEGAKLCVSCGKVVTQTGSRQPQSRSRTPQTAYTRAAYDNRRRQPNIGGNLNRNAGGNVNRSLNRNVNRNADAYAPAAEKVKVKKPRKPISKRAALIWRLLTVAVVIAAAYAAIFAVQTFRVKTASYSFSNGMKMSSDNYGEAIDNYFESGHWSVGLFSAECTYKGEDKRSHEWEIVFDAGAHIKVKSIRIDGERVKNKQLEVKLMAMFI